IEPDDLLPKVTRDLRRSAGSTIRDLRRAAAVASMRAGIRRGYQRARKAMAQVQAHPEDVLFHAWRRRVKDHWYHVRLLDGLNRRADTRARRLHRLETWLGDDHNLVLMRAAILSAPARFGDAR